jgi:phosphate transport system substrate-binding protein
MQKKHGIRVRKSGALAVFALLLCGAVSSGRAETAQPQLWLRGAGATFPAPLYDAWIKAYLKQNPGLSITYDAVGSGEGISRFITGSVDFGGSDAPLTDAQIAKVNRGVVLVPATAGMVVLAYSLPDVAELKLPRDVYGGIFAGEISKWNDPRVVAANPGVRLPNRTIAVVARLDGSGTTYAFTSHLNAISSAWRDKGLGVSTRIDWPGNTQQVRGNEGVAQRIKISEGAIGYVEYGFAKRLGLPVAALQNRAGSFVKPTPDSGGAALSEISQTLDAQLRGSVTDPSAVDAYPIVTYSWMMLYGQYADARKAGAIRDFVSWGLTEGQQMNRDAALSGYIPLPAVVVTEGQRAIASIR